MKGWLGMSNSGSSKDGSKKDGGWVSPNSGQASNGQRRQMPKVSQEQFNQLKAAVAEIGMGDQISDDIILKAC